MIIIRETEFPVPTDLVENGWTIPPEKPTSYIMVIRYQVEITSRNGRVLASDPFSHDTKAKAVRKAKTILKVLGSKSKIVFKPKA